jgi:hypothetical protein
VSSKPPRSIGPPRRISGSLTISPEILAMKKAQEETKEKLERIAKKIESEKPRRMAALATTK